MSDVGEALSEKSGLLSLDYSLDSILRKKSHNRLNKNLLTSEKLVPQESALKKINALNTFTTCPPSVINCTD